MISGPKILRRPTPASAAGLVLLFLLFLLPADVSPASGSEEEKAASFRLANGLRVFLYERHTVPLANAVFAFDLGSKDETEETSGLAHLLEHCLLFRGSTLLGGMETGRAIRAHGAYFNGHTGRDIMSFEMALPAEHLEFALRALKEILFHPELSQEDLDKEKEVILEEVRSLEDDPRRYATALAYQNLFGSHPYKNPVYGNKDVIREAAVDAVRSLHETYFTPSNAALAVVGEFDLKETEERIRALFSDLEKAEPAARHYEPASSPPKNLEIKVERDVNTAYMTIAALGPDYNHPDQFAVDVLAEALGGGVIPMLNFALRGRRRLVDSLSVSYAPYKYGGILLVHLTLDPKNVRAAKREALTYLKDSRRLNYSKSDYMGDQQYYALDFMESAKNRIRFRFHQGREKGLSVAASLARHLLVSGDEDRGSYAENVEEVTSSALRRVAGKYLSRAKTVTVTVVPKKAKNKE